MTSFIAWIGVDARGPASLHLASDSRISWGKRAGTWNTGRKLFFCKTHPDLFGYIGDVLFPCLVLGQLTETIDMGAIFRENENPSERFFKIKKYIKDAFEALPNHARFPFSIVYATRENEKMASRFFLWKLDWTGEFWTEEAIDMPEVSSALTILGSGENEIKKWQYRWKSSSQGDTSRAVFSGFCNSVVSEVDIYSGGAIQLVSLYRIGHGRVIGVVNNNEPYLLGMHLSEFPQFANLEWRNYRFERCNPHGDLIEDAQKHHVPKGLENK